MGTAQICLLPERGVIEIGGPEGRVFLQGLITNNMELVGPAQAIYAALLTPQGKFLFDFFVAQHGDGFLLECEAARLAELCKRLNFYKLRAKVTIRDASGDFAVAAQLPTDASSAQAGAAHEQDGGVIFTDPRLAAMGQRMILPTGAFGAYTQTPIENYHRLRLTLGLADGSRDIVVEKYFLLEANFEELNGVDFKKGCYVGQELVSRMKHRGVVRKRLFPVSVEGPAHHPAHPYWRRAAKSASCIPVRTHGRWRFCVSRRWRRARLN